MVRLLFILMIGLLTACSGQDQQAIIKQEETQKDSGNSPSLTKTMNEDNTEEEEMFLEFPMEGDLITINLSQIGILHSYLKASEDVEKEISNMNLRQLFNLEDKTIYLLQFACRSGSCSYLLLNQSDQAYSYLAADDARFKQAILSPNLDKILLTFSRDSLFNNTQVTQDKVVIMDINDWKEVPLSTQETTENFNFKWPILHAEWNDNSTVILTIPKSSTDIESIYDWYNSERETQKVNVKFAGQSE